MLHHEVIADVALASFWSCRSEFAGSAHSVLKRKSLKPAMPVETACSSPAPSPAHEDRCFGPPFHMMPPSSSPNRKLPARLPDAQRGPPAKTSLLSRFIRTIQLHAAMLPLRIIQPGARRAMTAEAIHAFRWPTWFASPDERPSATILNFRSNRRFGPKEP